MQTRISSGEGLALSPPVLPAQLPDFVLIHFLFALALCAITAQVVCPIAVALLAFGMNTLTTAFARVPEEDSVAIAAAAAAAAGSCEEGHGRSSHVSKLYTLGQ